MQNTFEIANLSKEEKIKNMEALWEELTKDYKEVESPGKAGGRIRRVFL